MIFDPDELLTLVAQLAAKHDVPVPVSRATMRTIVADAEQLAGGRADDEPAALFYACVRRARLFAKVVGPFLERIVPAQANAVGLELAASELDILLLRGRIASDAAGWEDVRNDFAGWLHRHGEKPQRAPPQRPR